MFGIFLFCEGDKSAEDSFCCAEIVPAGATQLPGGNRTR
ncbi:hypothetical protein FTUN_0726 [Frigoriglobus tundricola]|uniref:Uncharacterized protein n=1 Tax=Frigoriglobus tundricola TaxID=2774151 RepID=A0A6M5YIR8_9BACT|nr:hypothetical protein FTUN_0726 [Frigoriglobus tundricola]